MKNRNDAGWRLEYDIWLYRKAAIKGSLIGVRNEGSKCTHGSTISSTDSARLATRDSRI